jgi:hypothetical protein
VLPAPHGGVAPAPGVTGHRGPQEVEHGRLVGRPVDGPDTVGWPSLDRPGPRVAEIFAVISTAPASPVRWCSTSSYSSSSCDRPVDLGGPAHLRARPRRSAASARSNASSLIASARLLGSRKVRARR